MEGLLIVAKTGQPAETLLPTTINKEMIKMIAAELIDVIVMMGDILKKIINN